MSIKNRLALYFTIVSMTMLLIVLYFVYFAFTKILQNDFYERLYDRAFINAKLYLEADEITPDSLLKVKKEYLHSLKDETVQLYDKYNHPHFVEDSLKLWDNNIINKTRISKKTQFKEADRQTVGIFYQDNQGDYVIMASAVDYSSLIRIAKLRQSMVISFFLITIMLLLVSRWLAKQMLNPLIILANDVKQIKSNKLNYRVHEGKNEDEITLLAKNFNHLISHLEQAFILQKSFVANASHELRTPLTRLLMDAEITLSKSRSNQEYQKVIENSIEEIDKMNAIINALVNLAQSDLEISKINVESIQIKDVLAEIQDYWKSINTEADLKINCDSEDLNLTINTNKELLIIAINNLINNAFKFSIKQEVQINCIKSNANILISIKDFGSGIDPKNQEKVFEPFFTTDVRNHQLASGMGLYMTQKIIHALNGEINFITSDNGTVFSIFLPL